MERICHEPTTPLEKLAYAIAGSQYYDGYGHPDDVIIYGDAIIIASVDHRGAPDLRISSVVDYVTEMYVESYHYDNVDCDNEGEWPEDFRQLYRQCLADPEFRQAHRDVVVNVRIRKAKLAKQQAALEASKPEASAT